MRTKARLILLLTVGLGYLVYSTLSKYSLSISFSDDSGGGYDVDFSKFKRKEAVVVKPAVQRVKEVLFQEIPQVEKRPQRPPPVVDDDWQEEVKPIKKPIVSHKKADDHGHDKAQHSHGSSHATEENVIRAVSPTGQPINDLGGDAICSRSKGCKVIAAGSSRAGSTFLYNVARILSQWGLRSAFATAGHPDEDKFPEMDQVFDNKFSVVKVHEYVDKWAKAADVVILSHRDPRDVVASCLKMIQLRGTFERIDSFDDCIQLENGRLWHLSKWEKLKGKDGPLIVELRYEDFAPPKSENTAAIPPIAKALGLDISQQPRSLPRLIVEEVDRVRALTQYDWDPRTGFSKVHFSSREGKIGEAGMWKKVLTDDQVKKVERMVGWFMDTHGYDRQYPDMEIAKKPTRPTLHRGEKEMISALKSEEMKKVLGYGWSEEDAMMEERLRRKKKYRID